MPTYKIQNTKHMETQPRTQKVQIDFLPPRVSRHPLQTPNPSPWIWGITITPCRELSNYRPPVPQITIKKRCYTKYFHMLTIRYRCYNINILLHSSASTTGSPVWYPIFPRPDAAFHHQAHSRPRPRICTVFDLTCLGSVVAYPPPYVICLPIRL